MSDLTLVGLRVLIEVAQQGSLTAAANTLGYTQSAVSRQVQACEAAVGTSLFTREPRGIEITAAGEVLLTHARAVVARVDAAAAELAGLQDRLAGRLAVGAYPTAAASLVPRALAELQRAHPGLSVELSEAGSPTLVKRMHSRRIEVAVIATGEGLPTYDLAGLRAEVIAVRRNLGVAVSAEHRLATRRTVDVAELVHESWIVATNANHEPQFGAWPTLVTPIVAHRAAGWPSRLGLVAAGLGVSVLPGLAADIVPRGVVWLAVHDPSLFGIRHAVLLTQSQRSPAAAALVAALTGEASRMTDQD